MNYFKLVIFSLMMFCSTISFLQDTISVDSSSYLSEQRYEVSYFVSDGNIYSFRVLREGILIFSSSLYNRKKTTIIFLPLRKIILKKYNAIQNYIESNKLMEYEKYKKELMRQQKEIDSVKEVSGLTLRYINSFGVSSRSFVIVDTKTKRTNYIEYIPFRDKTILQFVDLLNDVLPYKYRKKYRIR